MSSKGQSLIHIVPAGEPYLLDHVGHPLLERAREQADEAKAKLSQEQGRLGASKGVHSMHSLLVIIKVPDS